MAKSRFSVAQYTSALKALLPRGRVWARRNEGVQHGLIEGLAKSFQQVDEDAVQLLIDAFPATTTALIDEWNSTVGIPDACFGAPDSIEQNRQYIVAKLIADGGQTVTYYQSIAASLGLNVLIREFSPSCPGVNPPEGMVLDFSDWAHVWQVQVDSNSPAINDDVDIQQSSAYRALSCLFSRYKPAHTQFYITVNDFNESDTSTVFGFDLNNQFISGFDTGNWSAI